MTETVMEESAL